MYDGTFEGEKDQPALNIRTMAMTHEVTIRDISESYQPYSPFFQFQVAVGRRLRGSRQRRRRRRQRPRRRGGQGQGGRSGERLHRGSKIWGLGCVD